MVAVKRSVILLAGIATIRATWSGNPDWRTGGGPPGGTMSAGAGPPGGIGDGGSRPNFGGNGNIQGAGPAPPGSEQHDRDWSQGSQAPGGSWGGQGSQAGGPVDGGAPPNQGSGGRGPESGRPQTGGGPPVNQDGAGPPGGQNGNRPPGNQNNGGPLGNQNGGGPPGTQDNGGTPGPPRGNSPNDKGTPAGVMQRDVEAKKFGPGRRIRYGDVDDPNDSSEEKKRLPRRRETSWRRDGMNNGASGVNAQGNNGPPNGPQGAAPGGSPGGFHAGPPGGSPGNNGPPGGPARGTGNDGSSVGSQRGPPNGSPGGPQGGPQGSPPGGPPRGPSGGPPGGAPGGPPGENGNGPPLDFAGGPPGGPPSGPRGGAQGGPPGGSPGSNGPPGPPGAQPGGSEGQGQPGGDGGPSGRNGRMVPRDEDEGSDAIPDAEEAALMHIDYLNSLKDFHKDDPRGNRGVKFPTDDELTNGTHINYARGEDPLGPHDYLGILECAKRDYRTPCKFFKFEELKCYNRAYDGNQGSLRPDHGLVCTVYEKLDCNQTAKPGIGVPWMDDWIYIPGIVWGDIHWWNKSKKMQDNTMYLIAPKSFACVKA